MRRFLPCLLFGSSCLLASAALRAESAFAYLFAHMTATDYGRLYYAVSEDGLHWTELNGGQRIMGEAYLGHPDIMTGPDGTYWLVGVQPRDQPPGVIFWHSTDLITWSRGPELPGERFNVGDRRAGAPYLGAPKLFYDDASARFYLTWHAARRDLPRHEIHGVDEARWSDMRTFVMSSPDLTTWTAPQRLFASELASIDVILRHEGDRYYAILKDEHYPTFDHPTGKSIRIASAPTPLGPWSEPGPKISPNYHEAPTLVRMAGDDGWLLYHEQYPGIQYGVSTAATLAGPWYDAWIRTYDVPSIARHGCMLRIPRTRCDALRDAFPDRPAERPRIWVLSDLSDPRDRREGGHPQNDPDDISALAALLLEANRFEIGGIVYSSTHRRNLADATDFVTSTFVAAYAHDQPYLERAFPGYPPSIPFLRSSLTGHPEARRFDPAKDYRDLTDLPSVQALVDYATAHPTYVLLWGPTTEAAIALRHCLTTGNTVALQNMTFVSHWTKSWIAQGTPEHPFAVANCRDDAAACAFLHDTAAVDPRVRCVETGSVGQTGIVNGSTGYPKFESFNRSRLGQILLQAKFYAGKPDGSDSATFWVLLDHFGPGLADYATDGSLDQATEEANRDRFLAAAPALLDDLRVRSDAAAVAADPFPPAFLAERFTYVYQWLNGRYAIYVPLPTRYRMTTMDGREVRAGELARGDHELDLADLPDGDYLVHTDGGGLAQIFSLTKKPVTVREAAAEGTRRPQHQTARRHLGDAATRTFERVNLAAGPAETTVLAAARPPPPVPDIDRS